MTSDQTASLTGVLAPELFPLLRHPQFEDQLNRNFADPLDSLLRAVRPETGLIPHVTVVVTPASDHRVHAAREAVQRLDRTFFHRHPRLAAHYARTVTRLGGTWQVGWLGWWAHHSPLRDHSLIETSTSRLHEREEHLQAASAKVGGHLFEVRLTLSVTVAPTQVDQGHDRLRQLAGALGVFTSQRLATFRWHLARQGTGRHRSRPSFLLAHDELATFFHPPTAGASVEGLQTSEFTELEPPAVLPSVESGGVAVLGRVRFRDDQRPVAMTREARRRHVYLVGATGTGKSTLLLNLMAQAMNQREGFTVVDVHGDLAEGLLQLVPPHRTNDVIVFDPAGECVVPFNPLACPDPSRMDQVASGVVSAFRKLYDSWGPRLENLLRFAVFPVIEQQGTLLDVLQLLTDVQVRDRVVPRIKDDVVRAFWQQEFHGWNAQYRTEAVSSVTNKILPFLTNRRLREIVTTRRAGLNLRQVMDRGQVLVINLSRGKLGQDNATLLGSLLLTALEQAALSRADLSPDLRLDHSLFLDEFQTLVTPSTAIMLSESRKYGLNLVLSHQLTRQLDEATRQSVLGNCGTFVTFRVGSEDAELLAPAFSKFPGQLSEASLMGLPNYTCYVRMLLDRGVPSAPFSIQTLPPPEIHEDRNAIVRRASQRRFGG
ncbi:MAG: type IV secretion system DNA-binding domain-containing protein [Planctomycetaceae bacterium]|nr:type IV secretion system DNA-binding domain-containing protein [Planctomycetaceae bacterium]